MSKSKKYEHGYYDDNDEYVTDKKTRKKFIDRRKDKKMKNAFRSKNYNAVQEMYSEDDY